VINYVTLTFLLEIKRHNTQLVLCGKKKGANKIEMVLIWLLMENHLLQVNNTTTKHLKTDKMEKIYKKVGSRYKEVSQSMNLDQELVITAAFRYALGRATYIVGSVCAELVRLEPVLGEGQKMMISREIQEYQDKHGKAGWDMDNDEWNYVKWLFDPKRRVILEAMYYGTDDWVEAEAVRGDDDIYYSLEGMTKYFHTTRNIRNK
jgi:hypothetical protein